MNDLTLDELRIIQSALLIVMDIEFSSISQSEFYDRVENAIGEREELESMDFNDCGDSCKI